MIMQTLLPTLIPFLAQSACLVLGFFLAARAEVPAAGRPVAPVFVDLVRMSPEERHRQGSAIAEDAAAALVVPR
jgi:hypothetical protein